MRRYTLFSLAPPRRRRRCAWTVSEFITRHPSKLDGCEIRRILRFFSIRINNNMTMIIILYINIIIYDVNVVLAIMKKRDTRVIRGHRVLKLKNYTPEHLQLVSGSGGFFLMTMGGQYKLTTR